MSNMRIKTKQVEEHLKSGNSITSWEAIYKYKATRLSAIIFNLRKKYIIDTIMIDDGDGCRFAKYVYRGAREDIDE